MLFISNIRENDAREARREYNRKMQSFCYKTLWIYLVTVKIKGLGSLQNCIHA